MQVGRKGKVYMGERRIFWQMKTQNMAGKWQRGEERTRKRGNMQGTWDPSNSNSWMTGVGMRSSPLPTLHSPAIVEL